MVSAWKCLSFFLLRQICSFCTVLSAEQVISSISMENVLILTTAQSVLHIFTAISYSFSFFYSRNYFTTSILRCNLFRTIFSTELIVSNQLASLTEGYIHFLSIYVYTHTTHTEAHESLSHTTLKYKRYKDVERRTLLIICWNVKPFKFQNLQKQSVVESCNLF